MIEINIPEGEDVKIVTTPREDAECGPEGVEKIIGGLNTEGWKAEALRFQEKYEAECKAGMSSGRTMVLQGELNMAEDNIASLQVKMHNADATIASLKREVANGKECLDAAYDETKTGPADPLLKSANDEIDRLKGKLAEIAADKLAEDICGKSEDLHEGQNAKFWHSCYKDIGSKGESIGGHRIKYWHDKCLEAEAAKKTTSRFYEGYSAEHWHEEYAKATAAHQKAMADKRYISGHGAKYWHDQANHNIAYKGKLAKEWYEHYVAANKYDPLDPVKFYFRSHGAQHWYNKFQEEKAKKTFKKHTAQYWHKQYVEACKTFRLGDAK